MVPRRQIVGVARKNLAGVLNLSKAEAKARAEQAGLLAPRQSLTEETLPPALPATAAELAHRKPVSWA